MGVCRVGLKVYQIDPDPRPLREGECYCFDVDDAHVRFEVRRDAQGRPSPGWVERTNGDRATLAMYYAIARAAIEQGAIKAASTTETT